jgi:hypothetical protein
MDNTNEIIQGLADLLALDTFKTFAAGDLARRFASVGEKHRYDLVIRNVGGAIERMAQKDPNQTISSQDILNLYNSFVRLDPGSEFKQVFADLLPSEDLPETEKNVFEGKRIPYNEGVRDISMVEAEAIEVDEWEAAIGAPVQSLIPGIERFNTEIIQNSTLHDPKLIETGSALVKTHLETIGCSDVRASLKHGVKGCLLYLASFPTTRGTVHINVPVAVKEGQPEVPDLFADVTGDKIYAFNRAGLETLIGDMAEIREDLQTKKISKIRTTMATDIVRDPVNVGTPDTEVDEVETYVSEIVPKALSEISPELADVEAILEDAILRKSSRYSDKVIQIGHNLVADEIRRVGYRADTRFVGDNERGMTFDATLWTKKGKVEVSVPVEVADGNVLFPSMFVSDDGSISHLNRQEIEAMLDKEELIEVPRYTAALVDMDYNSLRKIIHTATFDRKHNVAREALYLINDKFGSDAHASAIADYQMWIEEATADYSDRCEECEHYRPRGVAISSTDHKMGRRASDKDYCGLLHTNCHNVVKKGGICSRSHLDWDRQHDDAYKGVIMTSQIRLT